MNDDEIYAKGGRHALVRAARFARKAEKNRTFEWLMECADLWEQGWDAQWPDAPAYKGPVVHAEDRAQQEIDLRALTPEQLINLGIALDAERFRREND